MSIGFRKYHLSNTWSYRMRCFLYTLVRTCITTFIQRHYNWEKSCGKSLFDDVNGGFLFYLPLKNIGVLKYLGFVQCVASYERKYGLNGSGDWRLSSSILGRAPTYYRLVSNVCHNGRPHSLAVDSLYAPIQGGYEGSASRTATLQAFAVLVFEEVLSVAPKDIKPI